MKVFCLVFFIWNSIVFIIYGADKFFAVKKMRRISERALIISAFCMGGVGALLGMNLFRHKTRKVKFKICVPIAFLCSVGVMFYLLYRSKMLPI